MRSELADDYSVHGNQIDILVGSDYFWEFVTGSKITTSFGIYLIPSSLGLLLSGRYADESGSESATLLCITEKKPSVQLGLLASESRHARGSADMEEFWELEKVGIVDNPFEDDDAKALDQFNKSVYFSEGRYHVGWPWKAEASELPTNYQLALGRFRSLAKRLSGSNDDIRAKYQTVIDDQLKKGIIEKVDNPQSPNHPVHYLPHHPVVKPTSATTKVRIVYDASAKCRSDAKSLNECLYRGPVLLPDLCGVLIRFRLKEIALVSDIEKAFLQMALQPKDRDVTRFIWFKNAAVALNPDCFETFRFRRVPFGVISSPFLLGATIQHHLRVCNSPTAAAISKNIYVDNVICTVDTPQDAHQLYLDAKRIFDGAGMNLTEWCSNTPEFESIIQQCDRSGSPEVKVLGLKWNSITDTVSLNKPGHWGTQSTATKRQILKVIASVFDPLGLFQPVTLSGKCLLRDLWLQNIEWDEPLSGDDQDRWVKICNSLNCLWAVSLPRCVGFI